MTDRDDHDDTMRDIILGVYGAGIVPLAHSVARRWRSAGARPGRLLGALLVTIAACPVALLYVALATAVPLTVGFLMAITWPITVIALIQRSGPASPGEG